MAGTNRTFLALDSRLADASSGHLFAIFSNGTEGWATASCKMPFWVRQNRRWKRYWLTYEYNPGYQTIFSVIPNNLARIYHTSDLRHLACTGIPSLSDRMYLYTNPAYCNCRATDNPQIRRLLQGSFYPDNSRTNYLRNLFVEFGFVLIIHDKRN